MTPLFVGRFQGFCDLLRYSQRLVNLEWAFRDAISQCRAFDEFEDGVRMLLESSRP
jgi:hypothetical protein